jgi:hypothetical protein
MLGGNKFDPNNDIPDLTGKIFAVTGGSAGIVMYSHTVTGQRPIENRHTEELRPIN